MDCRRPSISPCTASAHRKRAGERWTISSSATATCIARACRCRDRGRGRHAGLRLFDRDDGAPCRVLRGGAGAARRSADRLSRSRPIPMPRCSRRSPREGLGADVVSVGEYRARPRRRHRAGEDRLLRRRQDRGGDGRGAEGRALPVQPRIGRGGGDAVGASPPRSASTAPVGFRVNPDVEAGTPRQDLDRRRLQQVRHSDRQRARRLSRAPRGLPGLEVQGVAVHIGSQLTDLAPLEAAFTQARRADRRRCARAGHDISDRRSRRRARRPLRPALPAPPSPEDYGAMVAADRRRTGTSG